MYPYPSGYSAPLGYPSSSAYGYASSVPLPYSAACYPYGYDPMNALPPTAATMDEEEDVDVIEYMGGNVVRSRQTVKVQMQCNTYFNVNEMLAKNILAADYFSKISAISSFYAVIEEIKSAVQYVEPFVKGYTTMPSTAFCILYKFFVMGMSVNQLTIVLNTKNAPFVRALGFLYLRYILPHEQLLAQFEPFFNDKEKITPPADKSETITMGEYVQMLLKEKNYYNTVLPRIKEAVKREIDKKLISLELKKPTVEKTRSLVKVDMSVTARFHEDKMWYPAKVLKVLNDGKFVVLFTEYGNEETVELSDIRVPVSKNKSRSPPAADRKLSPKRESKSQSPRRRSSRSPRRGRSPDRNKDRRSRSRDKSRRSRSPRKRSYSRSRSHDRSRRSRSPRRSRSKDTRRDRRSRSKETRRDRRSRSYDSRKSDGEVDEKTLEKMLRERAQNAASADGRKDYSRKIVSLKTSLSLKPSVGTSRKRSPSPVRTERSSTIRSREVSPPRVKSVSQQHLQKLEKLKSVYGNVAASSDDYAK